MTIYCNRFHHHKPVEVCYWTCPHSHACKDWAQAPTAHAAAIRERLAESAQKSGRRFEPADLVQIERRKAA